MSYNFTFSEEKIKVFMECYRDSYPTASVLPKMHILEEHVVPWLRMWHVGLGEQGAESIHKYFILGENIQWNP